MSTVNLGSALSLGKEAKRLSLTNSLDCFAELERIMGMKSDSEYEEESKAKEKRVNHLITHAEKTSLCFLVDCTGSMHPWINKVKENIKIWSEGLHKKHTNMELHVGFVRYTDHDQPKDTRTTWIDFTTDLDQFYQFVDNITTPGGVGGDTAEDVFGGLDAMLKLNWPAIGTKVLIHIADAPCHGSTYHDLRRGDSYPQGDPAGLQLDDLMKQLAEKEISYYFGYIKKDATGKMIKAFNSVLQTQSNGLASIQKFDASDPTYLLEGVFNSVTCSIMAALGNKRTPRDYTIDEEIPDWDTLEAQQVMISPPPMIGHAPQMEIPHQPMEIKIARQPFAVGGQKLVYHAYDVAEQEDLVLKQSKWTDPRSNHIKRCLETAQVHAIAVNFSTTFNRERKLPPETIHIEFVSVGIMLVPGGPTPQYFTYEPYIMEQSTGDLGYMKFNSNFNYILDADKHDGDQIHNDTCQAFSHYTWVKSEKKLVICDLQGVKSRFKVVLTDPAIHYTNILCHGSTNLGEKGILKFFQVHKCNKICRALKLDKELPEQTSAATLVAPTVLATPTTCTTKV